MPYMPFLQYEDDYATIPSDKTINDLLLGLDDSIHRNDRFIELNKFALVQMGSLSSDDYDIFWKCMKIFDVYGTNYFGIYSDILLGNYGDFSNGIHAWFNEGKTQGWRNNSLQFLNFVNALHFFCIKLFEGIPISEFDSAVKNIHQLAQTANDISMQRHIERSQAGIERKISNYFNFDAFSEPDFKKIFDHFALKDNDKSMSINEALSITKEFPAQTYAVVFKKGHRVCDVGKTVRPLPYIGMHHKLCDADSVWFDAVDSKYIDDLLIALRVFFDLSANKIRPSVSNRKYATLKNAIYVYQRSESIPKKKILSVIGQKNLRVIDLGDGRELIDKIALHRALFPMPF